MSEYYSCLGPVTSRLLSKAFTSKNILFNHLASPLANNNLNHIGTSQDIKKRHQLLVELTQSLQ